MPSRILVISPLDFALGFKLTGADTQGCVSSQEAMQYLAKEITLTQYDLILVDEHFLLSFDERFNRKIQASEKPLIMGIPLKREFREEVQVKDYILKMVQSAIGYEIRIK